MYRYNPVISHVIKEAANGLYGDIISVEAQMNCRHLEENRTWLKTFKGGMMFFLGCHLIDLVLRIQGMPNNVIPFNKSTGMNKVSAEDYGLAVFEYANGTSFVKTCDVEFGGFARRQLVITGTEGTVEIKPLEMFKGSGQYTGIRRFSSDAWSDMGEYKESKIFDRYEGMIRSFGQYVLGERKNPYSYDYELELYKTVLRCCGY